MSMKILEKVFSEINESTLMPSHIFGRLLKGTNFNIKDDESFYEPIVTDFDNFDLRHDQSVVAPIYMNDFDFNIEDDRLRITSLLRTEYDQNNFDTVASCGCRKYRSNIYANTPFVCEDCGTSVTKALSGNFDTKMWLRTPARVSKFINPAIYTTFFKRLNSKTPKVNIVDFWIDDSIRKEGRFRDPLTASGKIAAKLIQFKNDLDIKFGYNGFVENIDLIITSLLSNDYLKILDLKQADRELYLKFWNKHKLKATSNFFPVPNKSMTIVESDNRNRYFTKEQIEVNRIFQTISDLYGPEHPKVEENPKIMGTLYKNLVKSLEEIQKNILFGKKGAIRYHAGAGKLPFTGRSIITGASDVNRTDIVTLPWEYALTCLDKHLTNWLYNRGYTPMKVKKIIRNAANKICPIVEEFVDWIEANDYAVVVIGRQPSIQYLSTRTVIARFSRDIHDKSMRIGILSCALFGADQLLFAKRKGPARVKVLVSNLLNCWNAHKNFQPNHIEKPICSRWGNPETTESLS